MTGGSIREIKGHRTIDLRAQKSGKGGKTSIEGCCAKDRHWREG